MPWPYPSALTTTISSADPTWACRAARLARKAARSISARAVAGSIRRRGHPCRVTARSIGRLDRSRSGAAVGPALRQVLGQLLAAGPDRDAGSRRRPGSRRRADRASSGGPPGGQQGGADAAEDVPRAGLAGPGRAGQGDSIQSRSSGVATSWVAPLSSTVAPVCSTAARTARTGSSVTQERSSPSSSASSPACGVSSQLSGQLLGQVRQPVGVDHGRQPGVQRGGDHVARRRPGRPSRTRAGRPAPARARRPRWAAGGRSARRAGRRPGSGPSRPRRRPRRRWPAPPAPG